MLHSDMRVILFTWNTSREGVIWGAGTGWEEQGDPSYSLPELQRRLLVAQGGPRATPTSTYSWYTPSTTSQRLTTGECLLNLQTPEPRPRSAQSESLRVGPRGLHLTHSPGDTHALMAKVAYRFENYHSR